MSSPQEPTVVQSKLIGTILTASLATTPPILGFLIFNASQSPNFSLGEPPFSKNVVYVATAFLVVASFAIGKVFSLSHAKDAKAFEGAKISNLVVRLTFCEAIALVAFVWANPTGSYSWYLVFAAISIALMATHAALVLPKTYSPH